MSKLESALISLNSLCKPVERHISAVSLFIVTICYLISVLSIPLSEPQNLIWFAVYPIILSEMSGIGFRKLFFKSLWVLPFIIVIGIFNPFIDTERAFNIGKIPVSCGWVSFFSIILRGLLSVQAVILLAKCSGFYDMCNAMRRLYFPQILITQIQFTYRYMMVITEEALGMDRARKARGFGRKTYPLSMWGRFVGQLLIRSYERALRIHRAMLSRGFNGTLPESSPSKMNNASLVFLIIWVILFVVLRFISISQFLSIV